MIYQVVCNSIASYDRPPFFILFNFNGGRGGGGAHSVVIYVLLKLLVV